MTAGDEFERLVGIMRTLRSPEGCPWDREQTLQSLTHFVLEEAYEVVDAIERGDRDALKEEIGDHVFEGVFLAQVAADDKLFTIADSLRTVADKLVRREPGPFVEINPEDAAALGIEDGMLVRVSSRRGSVELRARTDAGLYRGLLFMTLHFPDQVMTNFLTIHATDPKSGTAEFKASAVKVEPIRTPSKSATDTSGRVTAVVHEPTA